MTAVLASAVAGLLTGFSLIVAIGAQNAFVLRQGLARQWVGTVVAICAGSDLALIVAGVGGFGGLLTRTAPALAAVRWLGIAFLLWFAAGSLRRAWRAPSSLRVDGGSPAQVTGSAGSAGSARAAVAARTAAFTWLNPHVYLDTVLILGTVGGNEGTTGRWCFAAGAGLASCLWFTGLGYGARLASGALASPMTWRALDLAIGLTMLYVAYRLASL
ncbi:LysE/ArgO family amino acid transporter [Pseudofrankia asymbiotica]|uniref:LysE/ArgO family amino acid transporter n=1 Tax=Pseudofrankia asymbiotica TaxID=1834516 RepID=UPI0018E97C56|nr:LysE family transporter [Pseudofrankia asymbiotica]